MPYTPESRQHPDVVANIKVTSDYAGSGWNFLINWPGFLIFTPAWNGYVYKANYQVDVALAKGADNAPIDSWQMPIHLNLRQAEIDRTWTEVGWLEWGVIPLIGGMVFTAYDKDVTDPLIQKIEVPIGNYVAQEIVNRINTCDSLFVPPKPAATPAVSPVVASVEPPKEAPTPGAPATNAVSPNEMPTVEPAATNAVRPTEPPATAPAETNAVTTPETPRANPPESTPAGPPEANAVTPQSGDQ
jgi:hypothetical protein